MSAYHTSGTNQVLNHRELLKRINGPAGSVTSVNVSFAVLSPAPFVIGL